MNTTTTTSSTTLPGELRVKRSTSRLAIAATAFLAILRRDIVVTGREFIVFLIQVLLQPLFFLFIFGKVLPSIGFARPGFAAILLPGIVALTVVTTALQGVTLPLVLDLGFAREIDDRLLAPLPVSLVAVEKVIFAAMRGLIAGAIIFPLAYWIPFMPRRASINRATARTLGVLRNMRRYIHSAHLTHEVFRIVGFICPHRNALRPFHSFGHQHGRIPLHSAVALQQLRVYHQSVSVLDHHVAAICQLRFMPTTLACQARVGVRGRLVGVIAPRLPVEVHRRVAGIIGRRCGLILPLKTLVARPSLDQRPVHSEVLVRDQVHYPRLSQHRLEELLGDIPFPKTIPILGEHCRHPYRFVHVQANKPPEQQVVLQLLHQHPFATNRVEYL